MRWNGSRQRGEPRGGGKVRPVSLGALSGLLCATLVGCSGRNQAPALPPVPLASAGPVSPDGKYDGIMQGVRGGELCGSQDPIMIAVRGQSFHFVLNQPQVPEQSTRAFDVSIAPDGSFTSSNGPTFIRGTVKAGHMQGAIAGDACGYDFEADRTGTF